MFKHPILCTGYLLIGIVTANVAQAQSAAPTYPSKPKPPPAVAQTTTASGPVLRKQPRIADVPATVDSSPTSPLNETPDDEAMNRIIRGICRGC